MMMTVALHLRYALQGDKSMHNLTRCNCRWHNQLNPDLCHTPFTPSEDATVIEVISALMKLRHYHNNLWYLSTIWLAQRSVLVVVVIT